MTYTFTDAGLSYFRCNAAKGVTTKVAETYTTPSSSPASVSVTPTAGSVATTSVTTIITTTYTSAGSVVTSKTASTVTSSMTGNNPGAQGQNQAGSNTTPTGGDGGLNASAAPTVIVNQKTTSTPLGAIVGGAVGGFAVLVGAIALFAYICFKRKKNRRKTEADSAVGGAAYTGNNANNLNHNPAPGTETKGPATAVAPTSYYENDKMAAPPPSYQSPQMQSAQMMGSPQSNTGFTSPVRSEIDGRAISPTPHSTGRAELASPPMSFLSGPANDWNRPYHELE